MNTENLIHLVETGDTVGLDALAAGGTLETVSEDVKNLLTRAAARAGQAAMLRHLFEYHHLYAVDPDGQGRTVLHFAAMSGDAETVRFAWKVLGFDPMAGDTQGCTALDYALHAPKQDASGYLASRLGFSPDRCYRNPVLRGFHPDPSVARVGEDYYLVNSSFVLFPGLPVFHSRDLVHWRLIGHAVENLAGSGLAGLPGGYGYWAPDISWHNGRFWVVATLRRHTFPYRLQMITSAADPRGPWDPPKFLPLDGIDPSLFTDDDGRRYILLNPGAILAEISENGDLISKPEMIFFGSVRIKPEGPHLLKKDGWYYLFLAEGGTGDGHTETVMRSRSLRGPYESCSFNPILSRRNPSSPIHRSGHGKLVSTPDGRWYMVYLCGRKVDGKTVTGRETALDPVTWTADGWPMVNALRGPSCLQQMPDHSINEGLVNNREWISPRNDPALFAQIRDQEIILRCGSDPASIEACSLLLQRQAEARFCESVRIDLTNADTGTLAGLAGYYDERSFFLFGIRRTEEGFRLEAVEQIGEQRRTQVFGPCSGPVAGLAVEGEGFARRLYLESGQERTPLATLSVDYLSDEGLTGGKRFTGPLLGIAAVGSGSVSFFCHQVLFSA